LLFDETLSVRFANRVLPDGSAEVLKIAPDGGTTPFLEIPPEDVFTTAAWRLSRDGNSLFMQDSRGRDTAALIERDLRTDATKVLAEDANADIIGAWWDPRTVRPLDAVSVASRQRRQPIDPEVREDLDFLTERVGDAEYWIVSQDLGMRLVVSVVRSDAAVEFMLYDRDTRTLTPLFKARSDLDEVSLRPMLPVTIPARDGLALPSYLTLPHDEFRNGPLVMVIHGGPYARDTWGYDGMHHGSPTVATRC
jgi:dipeptidyl aminopeptidase/acylaminoacyl peptidase